MHPSSGSKKCPFDHTKFSFPSPLPMMPDSSTQGTDRRAGDGAPTESKDHEGLLHASTRPFSTPTKDRKGFTDPSDRPFATPTKDRVASTSQGQPTFVDPAQMAAPKPGGGAAPQIVFNITGPGPVFIGYPMEQAVEFLRRYQGQ